MSTQLSKKQDIVVDAQAFKKNKKAKENKNIDDIIKAVVLIQKKADDGLQELANLCINNKKDE